MHKLYYIRHGLSEDNIAKTFSGAGAKLSDEGRRGASAAGRDAKAQGMHFDAIISSPYPRALQTAQLIAAELGFPAERIETSDLLAERNFGELTSKPNAPYFNGPLTYQDIDAVKGAETVEALQQRAAKALEMLRQRPEDSILVVAHNAFGRALRRAVNGIPYTDEYRNATPHDPIPHTTIIQLV